LSYTAVVDHQMINLTPLGKFMMPPPMFEKQVDLLTDEPCRCIYMYGNTLVAIAGNSLFIVDAQSYDSKKPNHITI